MQNALLLPRAQPRDNSLFIGSGGETWNWLQNLKEEVSRDLLGESLVPERDAWFARRRRVEGKRLGH